MKKTLYDLLEIGPSADSGVILSAYQRLSQQYNPDNPINSGNLEAATQFNLVKDAYFTLSNPTRRDAYDISQGLKAAPQSYEIQSPSVDSFWTLPKLIFVGLVVLIGVLFYSKQNTEKENIRLREQERILGQQNQAKEAELTQVEQEKMRAQAVLNQRNEYEQSRRDADRYQQTRENAEQQAARQASYEKQNRERELLARENKARYEEREALRRGQAEQAQNERKLREIERERAAGRVIVLPK